LNQIFAVQILFYSMNRTCKYCENIKPIEEFASAGVVKGKHYYRHRCKVCYLDLKNTRRVKIRKWLKNLKNEYQCEECGEDDFRLLDFHHVNGKKDFNIGDSIRSGYSKERILAEIKKCKPLCVKCHRIKTYEDFGV